MSYYEVDLTALKLTLTLLQNKIITADTEKIYYTDALTGALMEVGNEKNYFSNFVLFYFYGLYFSKIDFKQNNSWRKKNSIYKF